MPARAPPRTSRQKPDRSDFLARLYGGPVAVPQSPGFARDRDCDRRERDKEVKGGPARRKLARGTRGFRSGSPPAPSRRTGCPYASPKHFEPGTEAFPRSSSDSGGKSLHYSECARVFGNSSRGLKINFRARTLPSGGKYRSRRSQKWSNPVGPGCPDRATDSFRVSRPARRRELFFRVGS